MGNPNSFALRLVYVAWILCFPLRRVWPSDPGPAPFSLSYGVPNLGFHSGNWPVIAFLPYGISTGNY